MPQIGFGLVFMGAFAAACFLMLPWPLAAVLVFNFWITWGLLSVHQKRIQQLEQFKALLEAEALARFAKRFPAVPGDGKVH